MSEMSEKRMRTSDKAIALVLALAATVAMAAAVASPAGANTYDNGYKLAKFKVEVKGYQKMVQQHRRLAADACDYSDFSSGSETLTFRSKPTVITASYYPGQFNPTFFAGRKLGVPTTAKVERSFTPRVHTPAVPCEDNGGGVETISQPDCGTKTAKPFLLSLEFAEGRRDQMVLTAETIEDPFERCPGAGELSFPFLVAADSKDKPIAATLSQADLFNPSFRKWISIANGTRREDYGESWAKAEVRWEVSFTRLKGAA